MTRSSTEVPAQAHRTLRIALLVVCAVVAAPSTALAGGFGPPVQVAAAGSDPAAAVSASGEAIVAYNEGSSGDGLAIAVRPPGGAFGAPQHIADGTVRAPSLVMADSGEALLSVSPPEGPTLVAARTPGGAFGPPTPLPGAPSNARIVMARDGWGLATWFDGTMRASWRAPGGTFGEPFGIDGWGDTRVTRAWAGEDGVFRIGSYRPDFSTNPVGKIVTLATAAAGAPFGAPQDVARMDAGNPAAIAILVAAGAAGDVAMTWTDGADMQDPVALSDLVHHWVTVAPPGSPFAAPRQLEIPAEHAGFVEAPTAAVDPAGRTLVGWAPMPRSSSPGDASRITVDLAPRGAAPSPATVLDRDGWGLHPVLGFDASGAPVAMWSANAGLRAATLSAGAWCPVQTVAPGGFGVRSFVLNPRGGGLATWGDRYQGKIFAATYFAGASCGLPVTRVLPVLTARVGHGTRRVTVRLTCAGPAACTGRLTIGRVTRFTVPGGSSRIVALDLTARQRRTLRATGSLRARLVIRQDGVAATQRRTVTIRATAAHAP